MIQERLFLLILVILSYNIAWTQQNPDYNIKASLDPVENKIHVVQKIQYTHQQDFPTKEIYLNDWNHAYSSTESPLAKRLVEEYNRSFYLSKKSKRGATEINSLQVNGKANKWERLENQIDIIKVPLDQKITKGSVVKFKINYTLQLPDAKFTGYGITNNETYFLENFFLSIAWLNSKQWRPISHLDLEDIPNSKGNYNIVFSLPSKLEIESNLTLYKKEEIKDKVIYSFKNKNTKQLLFQIGAENDYSHFSFERKKISSNLKANDLSQAGSRYSLKKINAFLNNTLGDFPHERILLSQEKYEKRPFYGLTLVPSFLKPFPPQFEFEIKALNTYLYHYLNEVLPLHPREDYWLLGGIHTYLMMRYVLEYYPNKKLLGLVLRQPIAKFLLKKYHFKDLTFEDTFIEYHEFVLRRNLQQALATPKDELIKFNEQIGSPSQMGLLINYGVNFSDKNVADFIKEIKLNNYNGLALQEFFFDYFDEPQSSFLKDYATARKPIDLHFNHSVVKGDSISFSIVEKNNFRPPFSVGLVKNDSLIKQYKFTGNHLNTPLILTREKADYIVINPSTKLPEFNPRNNWKKLSGSRIKPLRLTFIKDLENPQYNQVFYNPRMDFNVYDGLSLGVRLNNKTIKSRPVIFILEPFYSTKQKSLVGSFSTSISHFNEESDYFLKDINLSGSSFHYNTSLRYSSLFTSINIFKRNSNLRDNKKQRFNLFWQYVDRDENENAIQNPNYSITGLNYIFSNKGALNYFTLNTGIEASKKFGKLNFTTEYRHLMRSGRQISLRLFAGKFLWRNNLNSSYFDYALDRPTDYLFQYNYIGRSETTGIYSQQFIPAEGGFKYQFDNPYSDDYLITLNSSIGIWKWIEAYGDLGYINQKEQSSRVLFDTGLRLNLVPDFLEIYFPIYNTKELQLQGPDYQKKIRYVITFDPRTLTQLLSRKWF
ncbi:MAG: hypothetical protein ACPGC8_05110 [Flavobacteriaceae bacterium]